MTYIDNLFKGGEELRKLMAENPDLPVVFETWGEANHFSYVSCDVRVRVSEVLKVEGPVKEKIYFDRDELEEDIEEQLFREEFSDDVNDLYLETMERSKAYEFYWTECILVSLVE